MKKLSWIILLVCLIASACASNDVTAPISSEPSSQVTSTAKSVRDGLGREVSFSELPGRIVVAGKATTLLLDSLYLFPEAESKIMAIENRSQNYSTFLTLADPEFNEKAVLPKDVGIEEIAALAPDLIILKQSMVEKLGDPLSALGFQVYYIDMETPATFFNEITEIGSVFGNSKRAIEISVFYQKQMSEISTKLSTSDHSTFPSVLLLQASSKEGVTSFSVPPSSWLQTYLVELAGGVPIWKDSMLSEGWETVTFEQIAAWNPDMIFIINYSGEAKSIVENLYSSDLWNELHAVKNGKLLAFASDFVSWDQPDSRWILGLQFLASNIHPELFEDGFIRQKAILFFSEMYGLTEEQINNQVLPLMK